VNKVNADPKTVQGHLAAQRYTIHKPGKNAKEPGNIEMIRQSWYRRFLNMHRECWKKRLPKVPSL
jgi:hypothetical protein